MAQPLGWTTFQPTFLRLVDIRHTSRAAHDILPSEGTNPNPRPVGVLAYFPPTSKGTGKLLKPSSHMTVVRVL